jgi:hypothetical protein
VKYLLLSCFWVAGCAQPSSGRTTATNGTSGGNQDMATAPGADLSGGLNQPDFGGQDLSSTSTDMAIVCDPLKQSGCGPGLKCTVGAFGPECASSGDKQTAELCGMGTSDDCVAGDLCVSAPNSSVLMCSQLCNNDNDCKQPAVGPAANVGHCLYSLMNSTYKLCTTPCDPVKGTGAMSGCPTGLGCIHGSTMTITELTTCEPVGTKVDLGTCANANECTGGYGCVSVNMAAATCRKVCSGNTDCAGIGSGYTCHKNAPDNWGYCF